MFLRFGLLSSVVVFGASNTESGFRGMRAAREARRRAAAAAAAAADDSSTEVVMSPAQRRKARSEAAAAQRPAKTKINVTLSRIMGADLTQEAVSGTCAICLEEDLDKDVAMTPKLPCGHGAQFHAKCFAEWSSGVASDGSPTTCPLCRSKLPEESVFEAKV